MPEFHLDTDGVVKSATGDRVAFFALPLLTQGYIKALFWLNTEGSTADDTFDPETGSALPEEVGFADLASGALDSIVSDCAAFIAKAGDLLAIAAERGYSEESLGHDFWLTRTGSGTGFTDREELKARGAGAEANEAAFEAVNAARTEGGNVTHSALWDQAMTEYHRLNETSPGALLSAIADDFGTADVYLGDDGKVHYS